MQERKTSQVLHSSIYFVSNDLVASHDVGYEQASLLMNAALLNAKLGTMEGRGSSDKLRKACNYFLISAGIVQHIIERYSRKLVLPSGSDMTEPVLQALSQLLLAQAQECFVLKGTLDKTIRDPMLAKLSTSASAMYTLAGELASREKAIFNASWIVHCQTKAQYFLALANTKKAAEMIASDAYGKELCRLEMALQFAREAKSLLDQYGKVKESGKVVPPELIADITSIMAHVSKNLERAKKDNDIIYHDQIPSRDAIGDIGVAVVANPIPFKPVEEQLEHVGAPIFDALPSYTLQKTLFGFFKQRDEAVSEIHRLSEEQRFRVDEALARMNLPAALEAREEPQGLPAPLLQKCSEVKSQGGSESLHSARATVQMLRDDCLERLGAVESTIKEEEEEDAEMREKHGSKWVRQASASLTQNLRERIESFRKTLNVANESDKLVITRLEENIAAVENLSKTPEELATSIPDTSKVSVNHAAKAELHSCLAEAEVIKDRLKLVPQSASEISAQLDTSFMGEESLSNEDKAVRAEAELAKFDAFKEQIAKLGNDITTLIERLQIAFTSFSDRTVQQAALVARTEAIHALESAYTAFTTLTGNFNEGIQFYSKCAESIQTIEEEVMNYRECRRFEFDDLMASIDEIAERERRDEEEHERLRQQQEREEQQQSSSYMSYQSPYNTQNPYGDPYHQQHHQQQQHRQQQQHYTPPTSGYAAPQPYSPPQPPQFSTSAYSTAPPSGPAPSYTGGPMPGAAAYSAAAPPPSGAAPPYSGGPLPGAASYSSAAPSAYGQPPSSTPAAPGYGTGQWTPGQPIQYGQQQAPPAAAPYAPPPGQYYGQQQQQQPQQPGYFPPNYRPPY